MLMKFEQTSKLHKILSFWTKKKQKQKQKQKQNKTKQNKKKTFL